MLPFTGLFKNINCPFFENNECNRAYCHFKHVKKGIQYPNRGLSYKISYFHEIFLAEPQQTVPEYKATPIASVAKLLTLELPKAKSSAGSNKRKLKYNPENPQIEGCSKLQKIEIVYVPTPKNASNDDEESIYEDIINCKDLKVKAEDPAIETEAEDKPPEEKNGFSERRNSSTSSTSTSSRHKSSKEKEKLSKKGEEDKSSSKSSRSKKSSHKDEERSSKKSSSRGKDRKDEKSSKSKSRSKEEERSSSSKSRRDKERSSRTDKDKKKPKDKEPVVSIDVSSITYQSCEEDEIDEECRRIFEELKSSSKPKSNPVEEEPKIEPKEYEDTLKKKRVAHEGPCLKVPTQIIKRTNHTQNAMQAVFNRQEVFRKKLEKEQEEAAEKLRIAQDNLKKAAEEYKKSQEKHLLTPLIPKSYLTPPSRPAGRSTIAPISNAIALAKAKKKVDELLAIRKGFTSLKTPTMVSTAAKGSARVAHNVSKATSEKLEVIAPPPLESGSSKISLNLRMQYYNLMVKHCIVIYTSKEDAWERAQNDELAVFKKCHTPLIYKSSALLAINKLKKEAEGSGNVSLQPKMLSHDVILDGKKAQQCSWSVNKKM